MISVRYILSFLLMFAFGSQGLHAATPVATQPTPMEAFGKALGALGKGAASSVAEVVGNNAKPVADGIFSLMVKGGWNMTKLSAWFLFCTNPGRAYMLFAAAYAFYSDKEGKRWTERWGAKGEYGNSQKAYANFFGGADTGGAYAASHALALLRHVPTFLAWDILCAPIRARYQLPKTIKEHTKGKDRNPNEHTHNINITTDTLKGLGKLFRPAQEEPQEVPPRER
jgi:hypothetical protein